MKAPSHYSPRPSPIHGCNPKLCARPGSGHRTVLTNLVRCCSAFAHTPTSPTSLDSRCSAILGLSPKRQTTARPLMRAKLLLRSTACIMQTNVPSAAPRLAAFGYLYRLLVRSSAYTIYHHRTRARVINYWRQGADVLTVSLPPTPSERTRKIRPEQPEHATRSQ